MSTENSWRDIISADELALYDAGQELKSTEPYNDHDHSALARAKQLESDGLIISALKLKQSSDPELLGHTQRAREGVASFPHLPANCEICNRFLCGDPVEERTTVVKHIGLDQDKTILLCADCEHTYYPLPASDRKFISSLHQEVWQLIGQGHTQTEVAAQLNIKQPKVSKLMTENKDQNIKLRKMNIH